MLDNLRCIFDRNLFNNLVEEPLVQSVAKQIEELDKKSPQAGTRRHLLTSALRLSPLISPQLDKMTRECVEKLNVDLPVELYVYSSPQFNAACFKPEAGRLYIMFSSSLIESFSEAELRFVLGHELGHYLFDHHQVPVGYLMNGKKRPGTALALKLFTWSRYAEISADRAGAYCAGDFDATASTLFKLASGVTQSPFIKFEIEDFLLQLEDLVEAQQKAVVQSSMQDWFSTHPFSPLRVKALKLFFQSSLMDSSKLNIDELESATKSVMSFMEPDYLKGKTSEARALRDLFIATVIELVYKDGEFTSSEKSTLSQLLNHSIDIEKIDKKRLSQDLPQRLEKVVELNNPASSMQVLRDLILVANADSLYDDIEKNYVYELAEKLKISKGSVDQLHGENSYLD